MHNVAPDFANFPKPPAQAPGEARPDTRVNITVCDTPGFVSSLESDAAAAVNDDTPGTTSYAIPSLSSRRICSAVAPYIGGIAGMDPRNISVERQRALVARLLLLEVELRGVNDLRVGLQ